MPARICRSKMSTRLIYRIFVPAMGTTLEFSEASYFETYKEMLKGNGWEFETCIKPLQ